MNKRLIPCATCGHATSPSAATCPSCGDKHFIGMRCHICSKRGPASTMTNFYWSEEDGLSGKPIHKACVLAELALNHSAHCADCDAPVAFEDRHLFFGWNIDCANCGSRRSLEIGKCIWCSLPMYIGYQSPWGKQVDGQHVPMAHAACSRWYAGAPASDWDTLKPELVSTIPSSIKSRSSGCLGIVLLFALLPLGGLLKWAYA